MLLEESDERGGGAGESAVAAINQTQLAPEFDIGDGDELYVSGAHFIASETLANKRNAQARGHEALDHADAWKLHGDAEARAMGAEVLVEKLPGEAGLGKNERLLGDFVDAHAAMPRERVRGGDHEHQAVAKDGMRTKAGRLCGEGDDADVERAVLDFFEDFAAEIPVNADLHKGVVPVIFREDIREDVEACRFVSADSELAAGGGGLVR